MDELAKETVVLAPASLSFFAPSCGLGINNINGFILLKPLLPQSSHRCEND